jgi:uncharacterized protein (TIGR02466 family)
MKNIHLLFPTPILVDNINRQYTQEETDAFMKAEYKSDVNNGATTTNTVLFTRTKNVLKEKNLTNIEHFVLSKANEYLLSLNVSDKLKLKITRSWFVKSSPGSYGRKHNHPNSLISGVLYLKTFNQCGNLILHKDATSLFGSMELSFGNVNELNSSTVSIPPSDGMLILFPSTMQHEVAQNTSNEDRYSLSFDIWADGIIGTSNTMTELVL